MADKSLTRLRVRASEQALEIIGGLLMEVGAGGLEEEEGCITAYADSEEKLHRLVETVEGYAGGIAGSEDGVITWETEAVDDVWETMWRQALLPQQITPTYTLRPTHCAPGPPSENTLWFEPEVSFGSGEHATTRMAAVAVEQHLRDHPGLQFLDVGTGTGVLAFVAVKTGASRAVGVDTDEVAIRSAQRNADLNDLTTRVEILTGGAEAVADMFEVVVANINTPVLLSCKEAICARVAPGGTLFLTGLLDEDVQEVCIAYATEGIDLDPVAASEGWSLLKGIREE